MPLRIGFVSAAHVHFPGFVWNVRQNSDAEAVGVWDSDPERLDHACGRQELRRFESLEALLDASDAVVICSENTQHVGHIAAAAAKGKAVFCEKPLVASEEDAAKVREIAERTGVEITTALPCRYAPSFTRLRERLISGEIGDIKALCATNHGTNPGGWFVDPALSGGGAMMDHTVHVADLFWLILGEEPSKVEAQIGNNMEGRDVDDSAMLTLEYPSGIFATLDASWSRPKKYKTWGDVTLNVVGEKGVLEMDMFAQGLEVYGAGDPAHGVAGYGSDANQSLIDDFVRCTLEGKPSPVSLDDGLRCALVAIKAYKTSGPVQSQVAGKS